MSKRRFVTLKDAIQEKHLGRTNYWLCRPGLTDAKDLQLVQATIPVGGGHDFHTHPELEEIIYVLSGEVEQWVEKESQVLTAGETAHIPKGVVHASFNVGKTDAVILAILSPGASQGPALVDVSQQEPWASIRKR